VSGPLVLRTDSADATRAVATVISKVAAAGDLLILAGELGAGKTTFAQGFAAGLGITDPVTSPTFTLVREYDGPGLGLRHLDVYRLEQLSEAGDLGLAEMLDEDAVMLIEWGDAIVAALPPDHLDIRITFGEGDDDRRIELVAAGTRWSARMRALGDLLSTWAEPTGDGGGASC
jgi:tRNA threonylcarbamoyladenosine biosynthesis protein TsaE